MSKTVDRAVAAYGDFKHHFSQDGLDFIGKRINGPQKDFANQLITAHKDGTIGKAVKELERKVLAGFCQPELSNLSDEALVMIALGRMPKMQPGKGWSWGKPLAKDGPLDRCRAELSQLVMNTDRVFAIQYKKQEERRPVEEVKKEPAPATKPRRTRTKKPA